MEKPAFFGPTFFNHFHLQNDRCCHVGLHDGSPMIPCCTSSDYSSVRPKSAGYQRVSQHSNVVMHTVFVFIGIKNIESLRDGRTNMLAMAIFYAVYYILQSCGMVANSPSFEQLLLCVHDLVFHHLFLATYCMPLRVTLIELPRMCKGLHGRSCYVWSYADLGVLEDFPCSA